MNKVILKYGSTAVGTEAIQFLKGLKAGVHAALKQNNVIEYYVISHKNEIHVLSGDIQLLNLVRAEFPYLFVE